MYLKPSQVAKMLNLSVGTIYNLIKKGELPNTRQFGNVYRIPIQSVEDYECGSLYDTGANGAPIQPSTDDQLGVHRVPRIMN